MGASYGTNRESKANMGRKFLGFFPKKKQSLSPSWRASCALDESDCVRRRFSACMPPVHSLLKQGKHPLRFFPKKKQSLSSTLPFFTALDESDCLWTT